MSNEYQILDTEFGKIWATATDAKHIYVTTHVDSERAPITVNRVEYEIGGHFHLWADGKFHFGREDDRTSQIHEPHMSKVGVYDYNKSQPSLAALNKTREGLTKAINEWAAANGVTIQVAELWKRKADFDKAIQERDAAIAELAELEKKVVAAEQRLKEQADICIPEIPYAS